MGALSGWVPVRVRVHLSYADLLPKLNVAIAMLKKEDRVKKNYSKLVIQIPRDFEMLPRNVMRESTSGFGW